VTPNPAFKVTVYLQVEYLKNLRPEGQSYYLTLIEILPSLSMVPLSMTLSDSDIKVSTFFDIQYLTNDTSSSHTNYRLSIGGRMRSLMATFPTTLTDP